MKETGRPLPIDYHLTKHENALKNIEQLKEHYKDNPRVDFTFIDNSLGKGNAEVTTLKNIKEKPYLSSDAKTKLNATVEQQFAEGQISEEQYNALRRTDNTRVQEPVSEGKGEDNSTGTGSQSEQSGQSRQGDIGESNEEEGIDETEETVGDAPIPGQNQSDKQQKRDEREKKKVAKRIFRDAETNREIDDLLDDFLSTGNDVLTSGGINPQKLEKGMKLVSAYVNKGVHKFSDIVEDIYDRIGDKLEDAFDAIKAAYSAYYNTQATDEQADLMDDNLRKVTYQSIAGNLSRDEESGDISEKGDNLDKNNDNESINTRAGDADKPQLDKTTPGVAQGQSQRPVSPDEEGRGTGSVGNEEGRERSVVDGEMGEGRQPAPIAGGGTGKGHDVLPINSNEEKEPKDEKPGQLNDIATVNEKRIDGTVATEEGTMPLEQYIQRAKAVLDALFPGSSFETFETTKEYRARLEELSGVRGMGDNSEAMAVETKDGRRHIFLDLESIRERGTGRTAFHEVIHPIVSEVIGRRFSTLVPVWNDLFRQLDGVEGFDKVVEHTFNYGHSKQPVEGITELLAAIADGKISIEHLEDTKRSKIYELLNKIMEALGINVRFGDEYGFKELAADVQAAFASGDAETGRLKAEVDKGIKSRKRAERINRLFGEMRTGEITGKSGDERFNAVSSSAGGIIQFYQDKGVTELTEILAAETEALKKMGRPEMPKGYKAAIEEAYAAMGGGEARGCDLLSKSVQKP